MGSSVHNLWLLALAGLLIVTSGCTEAPSEEPVDLGSVRVGIPLQPSGALLHIAVENGFFSQHGLAVEPRYYPSGKRALIEGLLSREVDVAGTAEIPFLYQVLSGKPLRTFATIHLADNVNRIVAHRASGIERLGDLKGRRLATQRNSAVHYFAHLVLQERGLDENAVTMQFHKAERLAPGLVDGEFDAFSMREPYVSAARTALGSDAVVLSAPGLYRQYELLVYDESNTVAAPVRMALLRGLIDAEAFARQHPETAIAQVAARLQTDVARLREIWRTFDLHVELGQPLLPVIERASRWVGAANNMSQSELDGLSVIDRQALRAVDPARLTIIE